MLVLSQGHSPRKWELCADRRRPGRHYDDFSTERSGGLPDPGDRGGFEKRLCQGHRLRRSGAVRVQSQRGLHDLHYGSARSLLQSRSHYQCRRRDRTGTETGKCPLILTRVGLHAVPFLFTLIILHPQLFLEGVVPRWLLFCRKSHGRRLGFKDVFLLEAAPCRLFNIHNLLEVIW